MGHPVAHLPQALPEETTRTLPDGQQLKIRAILPADLEILAEIYVRTYNGKNTGEIWTEREARGLLDRLFHRNVPLSLLAEIDGVVAGAAFADVKQWERGKVILEGNELFVDPMFQQKGIGALLLEERIVRAKTWYGVTDIEVITFAETEQPQKWYRELGYEKVTDPELQLMAGNIDEVLLNLRRGGKER